jgi:hypothetical protein
MSTFTDSTPFIGGVYRDRECCASVICVPGAPRTFRFRGRLSLKDEATLPLPRDLGFGRTLNGNPGVAPIRFFTVENTIKSNHPVTGWTGEADAASRAAASTADSPAQSNNALGGDMVDGAPRVVIAGRGLGGLATAEALRRSPIDVTLIDQTNRHLIRPLLYQVANQPAASSQRAGVGAALP